MSKTLLVATIALIATATAKPYIPALSSFYGPTGPFAAAYTLPTAPLAPALPAPVPAAAVPAPVASISAYSPEFAPAAFSYGGFNPLLSNYAPISSAYVQPQYAYAYGDAYYYRR